LTKLKSTAILQAREKKRGGGVMGESYEDLKQVLSTNEALAIICYNKHRHQGLVSCARISEMTKVPINKVKESCAKLEELKVIKIHRTGYDAEVEILDQEDTHTRHIIDEVIWENKAEYGKIYKKLITAELFEYINEGK